MRDSIKEQFAILAAQMDKREVFYQVLEDHVMKKKGHVPPEYAEDWKVWTKIEHRRPWRTRPLVIRRLKQSARKLARTQRK